jgi:hypothetical protein
VEQQVRGTESARLRALGELVPHVSAASRESVQVVNLAAYGFNLPGVANLIVRPAIYDRYRPAARHAVLAKPDREPIHQGLGALVEALLQRGAEAYGFRGQAWTCQRVGEGIRRTFGVTSDPSHSSRLLHRLGYRVQRPSERATQRNEEAVRVLKEIADALLPFKNNGRVG